MVLLSLIQITKLLMKSSLAWSKLSFEFWITALGSSGYDFAHFQALCSLASSAFLGGIKKFFSLERWLYDDYYPNLVKSLSKRPLGARNSYEVNEKFKKQLKKLQNFLEMKRNLFPKIFWGEKKNIYRKLKYWSFQRNFRKVEE